MDIFESLSGVFSCMLMIGLGYLLTYKGWFNEEIGQLFSKLAMCVAIPLYMIVSMTKSFTKQDLMQAGVAVTVPFVVMLIGYAIGLLTSVVVPMPEHRRGAFQAMFFVSNSGFAGFPVNVALFGEKALPYAVIYYLVQSMLFWTVGAYGMSHDGPKFITFAQGQDAAAPTPVAFSWATVKNVLSPPLLGSFAAVVLILGNIKLPTFLNTTFLYLGGMTTPLAMLFLGIAIYGSNLRKVRLTADIWAVVAARFLVAPAIVIVVTRYVPVPDLMRKVFLIEASMPVMTQVSIAARAYNADANYAAVATALTTAMAIVTIPSYFLLLHLGVL
jgi:malate permease and related proteins